MGSLSISNADSLSTPLGPVRQQTFSNEVSDILPANGICRGDITLCNTIGCGALPVGQDRGTDDGCFKLSVGKSLFPSCWKDVFFERLFSPLPTASVVNDTFQAKFILENRATLVD